MIMMGVPLFRSPFEPTNTSLSAHSFEMSAQCFLEGSTRFSHVISACSERGIPGGIFKNERFRGWALLDEISGARCRKEEGEHKLLRHLQAPWVAQVPALSPFLDDHVEHDGEFQTL